MASKERGNIVPGQLQGQGGNPSAGVRQSSVPILRERRRSASREAAYMGP
eukprot:gene12340-15517_t